ncbi:MAG: type IV pilus secretin PilQ [Acidobacteria bacterium]|nr:type IV pilus secretin PilQ [Acidobacteriota bacterium]
MHRVRGLALLVACGVLGLTPAAAQQRPAESLVQPAEDAAPGYSGHLVSLDFQQADLHAVLRTFSEISGLNIVIDPGVTGIVDVALRDVPWDQALDVILRTNRLGYAVEGPIVRIAPLAMLAEEEAERRKLAAERALSGELVVVTRTLSYARAPELAGIVTPLLSVRGQVQTDERTNTMIITDLRERVAAAEQLLDELDRRAPQVEIEAHIVQAGQDFARAIGVRWGLTGAEPAAADARAPGNRVGVSGRLGGRTPATDEAGRTSVEGGGTAVDLPAAGATSALGLTFGAVDGALDLDVVLSAAEVDGRVRLLSHPRVTTQNNVQAEIVQGDQIPIQVVANNTVTVRFEDAALVMRVEPQITAAGTVIMQLEIENDFADFGRAVGGIPPIVTQRARTTVQVASGETTVIGGIFEHERSTSSSRVPGLHRIPLLGWLFRSRAQRDSTDELLIFLTPRIVP